MKRSADHSFAPPAAPRPDPGDPRLDPLKELASFQALVEQERD